MLHFENGSAAKYSEIFHELTWYCVWHSKNQDISLIKFKTESLKSTMAKSTSAGRSQTSNQGSIRRPQTKNKSGSTPLTNITNRKRGQTSQEQQARAKRTHLEKESSNEEDDANEESSEGSLMEDTNEAGLLADATNDDTEGAGNKENRTAIEEEANSRQQAGTGGSNVSEGMQNSSISSCHGRTDSILTRVPIVAFRQKSCVITAVKNFTNSPTDAPLKGNDLVKYIMQQQTTLVNLQAQLSQYQQVQIEKKMQDAKSKQIATAYKHAVIALSKLWISWKFPTSKVCSYSLLTLP